MEALIKSEMFDVGQQFGFGQDMSFGNEADGYMSTTIIRQDSSKSKLGIIVMKIEIETGQGKADKKDLVPFDKLIIFPKFSKRVKFFLTLKIDYDLNDDTDAVTETFKTVLKPLPTLSSSGNTQGRRKKRSLTGPKQTAANTIFQTPKNHEEEFFVSELGQTFNFKLNQPSPSTPEHENQQFLQKFFPPGSNTEPLLRALLVKYYQLYKQFWLKLEWDYEESKTNAYEDAKAAKGPQDVMIHIIGRYTGAWSRAYTGVASSIEFRDFYTNLIKGQPALTEMEKDFKIYGTNPDSKLLFKFNRNIFLMETALLQSYLRENELKYPHKYKTLYRLHTKPLKGYVM